MHYKADYSSVRVLGFDADDTLWINESYFREAEAEFARLMHHYETENKVTQELLKIEIKNLEYYGYGVKSFMLSMIETALTLSNGAIDSESISRVLDIGKSMLTREVELLDGVEETLKYLATRYRLIVLTKGDLHDQERKLEASGLLPYFHHVEVLSEKKPENYRHLLEHLEIPAEEFLMIGNSLKSDILPLLELGADAVHIPFTTTWEHEKVTDHGQDDAFLTLESIRDLQNYL